MMIWMMMVRLKDGARNLSVDGVNEPAVSADYAEEDPGGFDSQPIRKTNFL